CGSPSPSLPPLLSPSGACSQSRTPRHGRQSPPDSQAVGLLTLPASSERPAGAGRGVRSPADVDLQHRAAVLARTELFGGIDEVTQRRIAEHVADRVVDPGQCVFLQDEPGDRMYVL